MNKKFILVSAVILSAYFLFANNAFAQSEFFKKPRLEINIPTITLEDVIISETTLPSPDASTGTTTKKVSIINIPFLCNYIIGFYKFAVALAIILVIVMIVHNGIKWAVSGGNVAVISSAKEKIYNAIVGLILLLGGAVILTLISPELGVCKSLQIIQPKIEIPEEFVNISSISRNLFSDLLPDNVYENATLSRDTIAILNKAMEELKEEHPECKLITVIDGATRTLKEQFDLWFKYCVTGNDLDSICKPDKGEKEVCKLSCLTDVWYTAAQKAAITNKTKEIEKLRVAFTAQLNSCPESAKNSCPHTSGKAIDLTCDNSGGSSGLTAGLRNNQPMNINQQNLIKTMLKNGFCVLLGTGDRGRREPWHFEINQESMTRKRSTGCTRQCKDLIDAGIQIDPDERGALDQLGKVCY